MHLTLEYIGIDKLPFEKGWGGGGWEESAQ